MDKSFSDLKEAKSCFRQCDLNWSIVNCGVSQGFRPGSPSYYKRPIRHSRKQKKFSLDITR